jgi:hypothetical protein
MTTVPFTTAKPSDFMFLSQSDDVDLDDVDIEKGVRMVHTFNKIKHLDFLLISLHNLHL